MTDKEIKTLAVDCMEGRVFGSWQMKEGDEGLLLSVFLPLVFMEDKARDELLSGDIAHFFGYMKNSTGMAINGYPSFLSMGTINKEEFGKLIKLLKTLDGLRTRFLGSDDDDGSRGEVDYQSKLFE